MNGGLAGYPNYSCKEVLISDNKMLSWAMSCITEVSQVGLADHLSCFRKRSKCSFPSNPIFSKLLERRWQWPLPFLVITCFKWEYNVKDVWLPCPLHLVCAQGVNDTDHTRWNCCLIFWLIIDSRFLAAMCSLLFTWKQYSGAMWAQLCPTSPWLRNDL